MYGNVEVFETHAHRAGAIYGHPRASTTTTTTWTTTTWMTKVSCVEKKYIWIRRKKAAKRVNLAKEAGPRLHCLSVRRQQCSTHSATSVHTRHTRSTHVTRASHALSHARRAGREAPLLQNRVFIAIPHISSERQKSMSVDLLTNRHSVVGVSRP